MTDQELLAALKSIMDSEQKPQQQAAAWLKVASLAMGMCACMIIWYASQVDDLTKANQQNISDLDKRISIVETVIRRVDYKE